MPDQDDLWKEAERLQEYWRPRTDAIRLHQDIRDLVEAASVLNTASIKGLTKIINNHPQAFWDWAVASIANEPLRWRVPQQVLKD